MRLIEKVSVEEMNEIAKELGPSIVKQDFEFFDISLSLNNLISKYFEPVSAFSNRFEFNVAGENSETETDFDP